MIPSGDVTYSELEVHGVEKEVGWREETNSERIWLPTTPCLFCSPNLL